MSGLGKKNRSSASNWGNLKSKLSKEEPTTDASSSSRGKAPREKRTDLTEACKGPTYVVKRNEPDKKDDKKLAGDHMNAKMKSNYVGLDCEMVGIGLSGKQSALARCCLVDFEGVVIYDKYVRPKGFVTDFRTQWSGIRKQDLRAGEAITLLECQENVASILKSKFLVGHALKNDLDVLMLSHPRKMIRDTATFKPYMRVSFIQSEDCHGDILNVLWPVFSFSANCFNYFSRAMNDKLTFCIHVSHGYSDQLDCFKPSLIFLHISNRCIYAFIDKVYFYEDIHMYRCF
jgi:DNA polymerase III epsilon subunit-like protein